jgi:integrase
MLPGFKRPAHSAMYAATVSEGYPADTRDRTIEEGSGARRTWQSPARPVVLTGEIRTRVDVADDGTMGARDRALILLGFAGAFRRSELVSLDVEDCTFSRDGLTVTLRRSKTDQDGAGRKIGIPYGSNPETCPVRIIEAWIEAAAITGGPLFRALNRHGRVQPGRLSGIDVARVVKKLAQPASWTRHERGHSRSVGAVDYAPDRTSQRADGAAVHPGREFV